MHLIKNPCKLLTFNAQSVVFSSVNKFWFSSNKNEQQGREKVFLNEESINKKMRDIQQKSQKTLPDEKQKRKNKEFMPVFTIPEINTKINSFRRQTKTEDLFAFSDISLEEKPTDLQITGYDPAFLQVDNFQYPPSIILTSNQILNWQVQSPEQIKIQHFSILKCLRPIPEYVIIGVPDSSVIKQDLRNKIKKLHHNVDILDLFQAISQFNTVVNSDRFIIAFLMSC